MPQTGMIGLMNALRHCGTETGRRGVFQRTNASHFKNTTAKIASICGMVAMWFFFSLAVEAAPMAVKRSLMVTTQVLLVDCTTHLVKKKACAPVSVTTDTAMTENIKNVTYTVRYY
jgi:hypothetical protein